MYVYNILFMEIKNVHKQYILLVLIYLDRYTLYTLEWLFKRRSGKDKVIW